MLRSLWMWVLFVTSCSAPATVIEKPPPAPADAGTSVSEPRVFPFDWPDGGIVHIVERIRRNDREVAVSYDMEMHQTSEGLVVFLTRFAGLNGGQLTEIESKELSAQWMPGLVIAKDGRLDGIAGVDAALARVAAALDFAPASAAKTEEERAMLRTAFMPIVESQASQTWNAWVEYWRVFAKLPSGETAEVEYDRKTKDGESTRVKRTVSNRGPSAAHPGHLELAIVEAPGKTATREPESWEVVIDPSNLRPVQARTTQVVPAPREESEGKLVVLERTYTFDWTDVGSSRRP